MTHLETLSFQEKFSFRDSHLYLEEHSLIMLAGLPGAGKSTFANKWFSPSQVVSSDFYRDKVCDDENSMEASKDAFRIVDLITKSRLKRKKLVVLDATNLMKRYRLKYLRMAEKFQAKSILIFLDLPLELCVERDGKRQNRTVGRSVILEHFQHLQQSHQEIPIEGYSKIICLSGTEKIDNTAITIRSSDPGQEIEEIPCLG